MEGKDRTFWIKSLLKMKKVIFTCASLIPSFLLIFYLFPLQLPLQRLIVSGLVGLFFLFMVSGVLCYIIAIYLKCAGFDQLTIALAQKRFDSVNPRKHIVYFEDRPFVCELKNVVVRGGRTTQKVFCKELTKAF